jgi:CelD/BcsL family acetyltransferase involved in cellulose biosynthesis
MPVYTLNPLQDPRWGALARSHPAASVFHSNGWLEALQRTYGYEPLVYTTNPPDASLNNAIVVCRVRSWLTGRRLVSVPFADHCEPLVDSEQEVSALIAALRDEAAREWKYVELRPVDSGRWRHLHLHPSAEFCFHVLDLRPDLDAIYRRTHPNAIQRNVRRAEREGLRLVSGRGEALMNDFYRLLVQTRRRHNVPPPPISWFRNLVASVGEDLNISVVYKDDRAIGSILTLQHEATLVYKYGCSDAAAHRLGTMPFLFWRAIEDAKSRGFETFDLGRSDVTNHGLIAFKDHLGAARRPLTYFRTAASAQHARPLPLRVPLRLFSWLPEPVVVLAGKLLYRHIA